MRSAAVRAAASRAAAAAAAAASPHGGLAPGAAARQTAAASNPRFSMACMVRNGEVGILGAASRRRQGFSAESEVRGLSSRVRRAAPSLQMPPEEPVVASCGPTKTAILTMLGGRRPGALRTHGARQLPAK